ncbi:unnamed protein product [Boreogadus saida]
MSSAAWARGDDGGKGNQVPPYVTIEHRTPQDGPTTLSWREKNAGSPQLERAAHQYFLLEAQYYHVHRSQPGRQRMHTSLACEARRPHQPASP